MQHLNLTHQQQIEAFSNNQTLSLIQSQLQAIKRAMSDCDVSGEDYMQEGIIVVLKKLKTWNPSKGSLTTHCWLDLRCKFNQQRHPVVYRVKLTDEAAELVEDYLEDGDEDFM